MCIDIKEKLGRIARKREKEGRMPRVFIQLADLWTTRWKDVAAAIFRDTKRSHFLESFIITVALFLAAVTSSFSSSLAVYIRRYALSAPVYRCLYERATISSRLSYTISSIALRDVNWVNLRAKPSPLFLFDSLRASVSRCVIICRCSIHECILRISL